jgi:hypothetical protein
MAFCTSCGKEVKEAAAFCTNCGAKTEADGQAVPPKRRKRQGQPTDKAQAPVTVPKERHIITTVWLWICVILPVLLFILIIAPRLINDIGFIVEAHGGVTGLHSLLAMLVASPDAFYAILFLIICVAIVSVATRQAYAILDVWKRSGFTGFCALWVILGAFLIFSGAIEPPQLALVLIGIAAIILPVITFGLLKLPSVHGKTTWEQLE